MNPAPGTVPTTEFILRRIHKNHVWHGPPLAIAFAGFRPTPLDTAGLSVYREEAVTPAQLAAAGRKPGEYYVARLAVGVLEGLGLTVVSDEQPSGPSGHAFIPELSFEACQRDNVRLRAIQVELAELASQAIVHYPDA